MKHIVQLGKYYTPVIGGIENNTRQLAEIAARDFASSVVCMRRGKGPGSVERINGVEVVRLKSYGALWRQEITAAPQRELARLGPDLVHLHAPNPLLTALLTRYVARAPRTVVVVSHHADLNRPLPFRKAYMASYGAVLRRAKAIIAYTRTFAESADELDGHRERLTIIPHGIELDFDPPDRVAAAQAEIGSEPIRPLTVGFLGRLERWKGVDTLLSAAAKDAELQLCVAGSGQDAERLQYVARVNGLADRVRFLGDVRGSAKREFMEAVDVLVLPSLTPAESYGQVLVEGQLCGLPVVASDLPTGVREICDGGHAGILVPPGNVEALGAALVRLRAPSARASLGAAGRESSRQRFSRAAVEEAINEFYNRVLS